MIDTKLIEHLHDGIQRLVTGNVMFVNKVIEIDVYINNHEFRHGFKCTLPSRMLTQLHPNEIINVVVDCYKRKVITDFCR